MARSIHLISWFLCGCVNSSFVAWFGSLHPATAKLAITFYSLLFVAWVVCWIADDAIAPYLRAMHINYYAALIGFACSILLGGVTIWLNG